MRRTNVRAAWTAGVLAAAVLGASASAQYPKVPPELQSKTDEAKRTADRKSDEAFAAAKARMDADAAAGKPYVPGAREPGDLPQSPIPAFPGAEGGGMYSFGGRGGRVIVVTSLEDSGPGTLRDACEQAGARIVVFNVSGIIRLKQKIRIRAPYITIAGQTAPGDGVCVAGNTVELEGHDIVIRHMRFRRGNTDVTDRNDSIGGNPIGNVMIDHVSASWGSDENMSMYRHMYQPPDGSKELKLPTVNLTIQNSIFSEGLNTYHHAFGSTIGGRNDTFMRNLWANNTGRNPSMGMGGDFNLVNNVIYNWRHRTTDGGDASSRVNLINNYYKPGPATPKGEPIGYRLIKGESRGKNQAERVFGKFHVAGNVVDGNEAVSADNWAGGVQFADKGDTGGISVGDFGKPYLEKSKVAEPFAMAPMRIVPAKEAYDWVLTNAGATLPKRDAVDERVIGMVREGKVTTPNVAPDIHDQLNKVAYTEERVQELIRLIPLGMITDPSQVGGYPEYKGQPYADQDSDGLPDEWETSHGLDPANPADATADANGDGYSNVEDFLNGTDPRQKYDWSDLKNNVDPRSAK